MTDYGIVKSTVKPEPIKIDEYSVWVNTDIQPVEEETFTGWQYKMVQYSKDEYILQLQQKNNKEITDIELALCEIIEGMEV